MRHLCLALAIVCLASVAGAMSTCKTLDLELVKRKRIEAIRGQILSKLRMAKEPEPEDDPKDEIPDNIISIYNSTVETTEDQQSTIVPETEYQEEEEYFGKEMHKFNMTQCKYLKFWIEANWTGMIRNIPLVLIFN